MVDLYVYYKVAGADAARLAPRVRAMQAALASSAGVTGQLKRRPDAPVATDAPDGLQTWMEVYPDVDAAFSARLAAAADAAGLADAIAGNRHAEVFIELDGGPKVNANFTAEDAPCA